MLLLALGKNRTIVYPKINKIKKFQAISGVFTFETGELRIFLQGHSKFPSNKDFHILRVLSLVDVCFVPRRVSFHMKSIQFDSDTVQFDAKIVYNSSLLSLCSKYWRTEHL